MRSQLIISFGGLLVVAVACSTGTSGDEPADVHAGAGPGGEGGVAGSVEAGGGGSEAVASAGGAPAEWAPGGAGAATGGFASIACADETRAVPYEAGLELTSEELGLRLRLAQSRPTPRVGNLTWTLRVEDAAGEPVNGASVKVSPFMPDHHHGSPLIPTVKESGDGVYVATPINLIMPGFWRTTVRVTTDGWTDTVIIPLCIE
ncbi:MAG TPA: FixH family protein [Polyangiaceae bacterium]|nr:FixH family protein [Polyangiaceae bacterium]